VGQVEALLNPVEPVRVFVDGNRGVATPSLRP
jgi:hypothetical protein